MLKLSEDTIPMSQFVDANEIREDLEQMAHESNFSSITTKPTVENNSKTRSCGNKTVSQRSSVNQVCNL